MATGPNMWSTLGSGLNDFAKMWQSETDRRYKRDQDEKRLKELDDRYNTEQAENKRRYDQEWNAKVAEKNAAEAAAEEKARKQQEFNQGLAELRTKGVKETRTRNRGGNGFAEALGMEPTVEEERYRPATSNDIYAYLEANGMMGDKSYSNLDSRLNNEFNQDLNDKKFTEQKRATGVTESQNWKKIGISQQNADTAAKKAAQPSKGDVKDEKKRREKDAPIIATIKGVDGGMSGNITGYQKLAELTKDKSAAGRFDILASIVTDSFLQEQMKANGGDLNALKKKFLNGNEEQLNAYKRNIDPIKLLARLKPYLSEEAKQELMGDR